MGELPYQGVRILELSTTLAGRLAGLLFADQGAEVFIERTVDFQAGEHDEYFDRNKTALPPGRLEETSSADIICLCHGRKRYQRRADAPDDTRGACPPAEKKYSGRTSTDLRGIGKTSPGKPV